MRVRRFYRFFRPSAGALESFALARCPKIDSREQHGQLRRLELNAILGARLRHLVASSFKPFIPDGQPVAVEVEDLDPIPATVEKQKEMAGQWVLIEAFLDQAGEAVE